MDVAWIWMGSVLGVAAVAGLIERAIKRQGDAAHGRSEPEILSADEVRRRQGAALQAQQRLQRQMRRMAHRNSPLRK